MQNKNALELPPGLAVRCETDVFAVVEEFALHTEPGPVCEGEIVGSHDLARCVRGRDDEDGDTAEVEKHQRPMFLGQEMEILVDQFAELMEISDYR